jgi:SHS2 domain-containing protein
VKNYEVLEHTADIRLRIKGKNLKELFKNAALSIFDISSRKQFTKNKKHADLKIKLKADSLEELFVLWLNELLSLSSAKNLIFHGFKIIKLEDNYIEAMATGGDMNNYKVHTEIKAVTYHELKVIQSSTGCIAEVILDV